MRTKILLALLILAVSTCVVASLNCSKLSITLDAHDSTCGSCNQWAAGRVVKNGSDYGLLCLYLCGKHSFNLCDHTLTLWVGSEWNFNCFNVPSNVSSVYWTLESDREDWDDGRGAYAELYIYIPCLNCEARHVTPTWTRMCPYCENCGS